MGPTRVPCCHRFGQLLTDRLAVGPGKEGEDGRFGSYPRLRVPVLVPPVLPASAYACALPATGLQDGQYLLVAFPHETGDYTLPHAREAVQ